MTPKEKAEELVKKYYGFNFEYECWEQAKGCALIAVDEIIKAIGFSVNDEYYAQVKQEIKKL